MVVGLLRGVARQAMTSSRIVSIGTKKVQVAINVAVTNIASVSWPVNVPTPLRAIWSDIASITRTGPIAIVCFRRPTNVIAI